MCVNAITCDEIHIFRRRAPLCSPSHRERGERHAPDLPEIIDPGARHGRRAARRPELSKALGWSNRNVYATTFSIRSNPFGRHGRPRTRSGDLPRPSTLSMPKDVDARANPRTESGTRVVVKRSPPEDARDDENPNCTACARGRYVAWVGGADPGRTGGGSERRSGGGGVHGLWRDAKDDLAGRERE